MRKRSRRKEDCFAATKVLDFNPFLRVIDDLLKMGLENHRDLFLLQNPPFSASLFIETFSRSSLNDQRAEPEKKND
jgi:hypothetical protein